MNGKSEELIFFAEPHKSICNCAHCENANENVFITIVLMRFLFIYHNNDNSNNYNNYRATLYFPLVRRCIVRFLVKFLQLLRLFFCLNSFNAGH